MAEAVTPGRLERVRRFSTAQIIEHWLQVIAFVMLALTGIPQRYTGAGPSRWIIELFGGIEAIRIWHRVFAAILMIAVVYHFAAIGYRKFVRKEPKQMVPTMDDLRAVGASVGHALGLRKHSPKQGRYTWEEKVEYWALIWGTVVMIITGFLLWNPIATTQILPGQFIPAAKEAHSFEALLAVAAVIVWHVYHVHVRDFNRSMFTGYLSREEMEEEHPLELEALERGETFGITDEREIRRRSSLYFPAAIMASALLLLGIYFFTTFENTAIRTIEPIEGPQVFAPVETTTTIPSGTTTTTLPDTTTTTVPAQPTWDTGVAALFDPTCTGCHGADDPSSGLDLSSYEGVLAGGDGGPAAVPGDPDASSLVTVMEAGGHPAMLDAEGIETVRAWIAAGVPESPGEAEPPAAADTWEQDVAAFFDPTCTGCHGADNQTSGLSLASYDAAVAGGDGGPGIAAGNPDDSVILQVMAAGGHPAMIEPDQIERLRAWIAAGAPETEADVGEPPPPEPEVVTDDWNTAFGPIFDRRCTACHGGDDPAAALNLETYQGALEGGTGGPGIVPGDPEAGTIPTVLAARQHFAVLSESEFEAFAAWIAAGAPKAFGPTWAVEIGPVLQERCGACHNPVDPAGGLDLSTYEGALAGGESGPPILPGDPDGSLIVGIMQAGEHFAILTGDLLDELRQWIADGAFFD